jgi:hypothetical protein
MKGKIALLVGATAGYVLGTRDGRQRYEQIKTKAESLWQDPKVQDKVSQVTEAVSNTTQDPTQSAPSSSSAPSTSSTPSTGSSSTGGVDG